MGLTLGAFHSTKQYNAEWNTACKICTQNDNYCNFESGLPKYQVEFGWRHKLVVCKPTSTKLVELGQRAMVNFANSGCYLPFHQQLMCKSNLGCSANHFENCNKPVRCAYKVKVGVLPCRLWIWWYCVLVCSYLLNVFTGDIKSRSKLNHCWHCIGWYRSPMGC